MCSVLFGAELYLTSSVRFEQNGKTPLRLVTTWLKWGERGCQSLDWENNPPPEIVKIVKIVKTVKIIVKIDPPGGSILTILIV